MTWLALQWRVTNKPSRQKCLHSLFCNTLYLYIWRVLFWNVEKCADLSIHECAKHFCLFGRIKNCPILFGALLDCRWLLCNPWWKVEAFSTLSYIGVVTSGCTVAVCALILIYFNSMIHRRNPPLVFESVTLIVRHAYTPHREDELAWSQPAWTMTRNT